MLELQGYYDGEAVQTIEKYSFAKNQRLIIKVLDDEETVKENELKALRGCFSKYANQKLQRQEKNAWSNAVRKKYK